MLPRQHHPAQWGACIHHRPYAQRYTLCCCMCLCISEPDAQMAGLEPWHMAPATVLSRSRRRHISRNGAQEALCWTQPSVEKCGGAHHWLLLRQCSRLSLSDSILPSQRCWLRSSCDAQQASGAAALYLHAAACEARPADAKQYEKISAAKTDVRILGGREPA